MSQINLSNWEIVDDTANSRIVIRQQTTGETLEVSNSGVLQASSGITGLPEPTSSGDAATKSFVESVAQGLTIKDSVRVSNHDQNIDLTSSTDPNPVDGVTLSDGDRILLKHQTDATENGIYDAVTATDPTTWVRSTDFDEDAEVTEGTFTFVREGTHANESYVVTTSDPIAVGTDPINFAQFSQAGTFSGGDGITVSGQVIDAVVSDLTGTTLQTDGNNNLEVNTSEIDEGYGSAPTVTSNTTVSPNEVTLVDASGGAITVTLPTPANGDVVTVKKIDSTTNTVTIATPGSETIDGQSSITISNQFATREAISNGTNYFII